MLKSTPENFIENMLLSPYLISKVFEIIFNHVESFRRKYFLYTCFKKVLENVFSNVAVSNKINTKKENKSVSTFDFTTLHMTISQYLQIKYLCELINFVFKSKT